MAANKESEQVTSLTIIIPFLKETATELFEETLASVLEFRPAYADILVVNAAGYDDCWQISDEGVGFCHADPGCGLIEAINIGIQNAATEIVHPILCGGRVEEGWADVAMARFEKSNIAAVVPLVMEKIREDAPMRKRAGLVYVRSGEVTPYRGKKSLSAESRFAPTPGGAFFRREPLADLGGLEESLDPWFACVDAALLLWALNGRTVYEKDSHIVYEPNVLCPPDRTAWLTGQETLFWRWSDFGGAFKTKRLHAFRLWKEGLAALFHGERSQVRRAYRAGQIKSGLQARQKKIAAARAALIARRKNGSR